MIDDDMIVKMYEDKVPIHDMKELSGLTRRMLYKRLRANGVVPNRKVSTDWTDLEEDQLVSARNANITGQELCDWVPTRTLAGIKGHLIKMGLTRSGASE